MVEATVDAVLPGAPLVLALDGSPRRFVEYLQGFCPEPAQRGDRCDQAGF